MKKFYLFLFLLFTVCIYSFAQAPALVWAKRVGGSSVDISTSVAVDGLGNIYTAGWFEGTTDFDPGPGTFNLTSFTLPGYPNNSACVSKLDAAGNFQWAISVNCPSDATSIALDASGNVYVAGEFFYTGDFDPGPGNFTLTSNAVSGFILKLDGSGNFFWARSLGGDDNGSCTPHTIVVKNTGVYTTGVFRGHEDFDPGPGAFTLSTPDPALQNVFISKLDLGGNFVWAKSFSSGNIQLAGSLAVDNFGNVYSTGQFAATTTTDFDPGPSTFYLTGDDNRPAFVSKLDVSGNFVWAKQLGGRLGTSIAVDASGNVYTSGFFESTGDFDPGPGVFNMTSAGNTDIYISRLDAAGNFIWAKQMGSDGFDAADCIALDASSGVYIAGHFSNTVDFDPGPGTFNLTSVGGIDFSISKLNASGDFEWAERMGGAGDEFPFGIAISSNEIYVTGTFQQTADFDPGPGTFNLTSAGEQDMFTVKLTPALLLTFYRDQDGDSYGDPNTSTQAAIQPPGYVSNNTDCNDNNAAVHPGATEVCNGLDDNCDGQIDEGVTTTFFRDLDNDGYGSASSGTIQACSPPVGYVSNNNDCNDNNATVHPGATEVCNGIDDNCDGQIDEGVTTTFYRDLDNDGYGSASSGTIQACSAPAGYVSNNNDCNDNNVAIHPGATEVCNGLDDNCDGQIDNGIQLTYYRDNDGDGYGDPAVSVQNCTQPSGYVSNNGDCNDNNAAVHPGATEICNNNIDDDCDGEIDEDCPALIQKLEYFFDTDPGIGNGITLTLPQVVPGIDSTFTFDVSSLSNGMHTIYVRSKDVAGKWSLNYSSSFIKTNGTGGPLVITRLEYFVDTDQGYGNGINIPLQPGNLLDSTFHISIPADSLLHNWVVRAQDSRGLWSLLYSDTARNRPLHEGIICPGDNISFDSKTSGTTYQWQVDQTGIGFTNITNGGIYSGVDQSVLNISNAPSSTYGYIYRCLVNGTLYSPSYILKFGMTWEGNISNTWENPANWSCGILPDANSDVIINGGKANYPQINSNISIRTLTTNPGSSVKVNSGFTLNILK